MAGHGIFACYVELFNGAVCVDKMLQHLMSAHSMHSLGRIENRAPWQGVASTSAALKHVHVPYRKQSSLAGALIDVTWAARAGTVQPTREKTQKPNMQMITHAVKIIRDII